MFEIQSAWFSSFNLTLSRAWYPAAQGGPGPMGLNSHLRFVTWSKTDKTCARFSTFNGWTRIPVRKCASSVRLKDYGSTDLLFATPCNSIVTGHHFKRKQFSNKYFVYSAIDSKNMAWKKEYFPTVWYICTEITNVSRRNKIATKNCLCECARCDRMLAYEAQNAHWAGNFLRNTSRHFEPVKMPGLSATAFKSRDCNKWVSISFGHFDLIFVLILFRNLHHKKFVMQISNQWLVGIHAPQCCFGDIDKIYEIWHFIFSLWSDATNVLPYTQYIDRNVYHFMSRYLE